MILVYLKTFMMVLVFKKGNQFSLLENEIIRDIGILLRIGVCLVL